MRTLTFIFIMSLFLLPSSPLNIPRPLKKTPKITHTATTAAGLRNMVFVEHFKLSDITVAPFNSIQTPTATTRFQTQPPPPPQHEVLRAITARTQPGSKPGFRKNDKNTIGLIIEGGGMRASVGAGMLSAIAVLDLADAFDLVYGSSAGAICGAYFVSRQMCVDVLTRVLVAAKTKFVNKTAIYKSIAYIVLEKLRSPFSSIPFPFTSSKQVSERFYWDWTLWKIIFEVWLRSLWQHPLLS